MLAVAYTLRLEDLARDVHAHTVGAAIAAAFGVQQVAGDLADWEVAKRAFDVELAATPLVESADRDDSPRGIKLRALGVA